MKSVMTTGGIPTFVSGKEWKFLEEMFDDASMIYKSDLNEQNAEIAKVLTSRGVLCRFNDSERGIYFVRNENKGISK